MGARKRETRPRERGVTSVRDNGEPSSLAAVLSAPNAVADSGGTFRSADIRPVTRQEKRVQLPASTLLSQRRAVAPPALTGHVDHTDVVKTDRSGEGSAAPLEHRETALRHLAGITVSRKAHEAHLDEPAVPESLTERKRAAENAPSHPLAPHLDLGDAPGLPVEKLVGRTPTRFRGRGGGVSRPRDSRLRSGSPGR